MITDYKSGPHLIPNNIVKFKIPGLNGPRTISGTVKRILANGKLEVKSQNDGYHIIEESEIL